MTDSAISITSEDDDEEAGEDLGGLDDLLASLKAEEEPASEDETARGYLKPGI